MISFRDREVTIPGIGVAGNVAGHMAQAGEAGQDAIGSGMKPFFTTFFVFLFVYSLFFLVHCGSWFGCVLI